MYLLVVRSAVFALVHRVFVVWQEIGTLAPRLGVRACPGCVDFPERRKPQLHHFLVLRQRLYGSSVTFSRTTYLSLLRRRNSS